MYSSYWRLNVMPFENTPDPRFFFASERHEEAQARILYAIRHHKGIAILTGTYGYGKTLIAQVVFKELSRQQYCTAYVPDPPLDPASLLRAVVRRLSGTTLPTAPQEFMMDAYLELLEDTLQNLAKEGREAVVVIDEAHLLKEPAMLERLRLFLNYQTTERFLVTLLLLGQPELEQRVRSHPPLEQRIAIRASLQPLNERETAAYVTHRLTVAGRTDAIFEEPALAAVFAATGGVPRRINRLCDVSLLAGFGTKVTHITRALVEEEAANLDPAG